VKDNAPKGQMKLNAAKENKMAKKTLKKAKKLEATKPLMQGQVPIKRG